jgi:ribonucleoside-diphosphate reductase alpha chain
MLIRAHEDLAPIAHDIWEQKYRLREGDRAIDHSIDDTFRRVAQAAASVETGRARTDWAATYHAAMADYSFLPAGRILAGAGTSRDVTLFNCFVLGRIEDDLGAIFDAVKEAALTMQAGGGIGHDFSTLRPRGAPVHGMGGQASGPVSFMDVWDSMCRTILSAGQRRGAMMATLACNHPDIETFITAKSDPARLRNFNLSVLVSDALIDAVKRDAPWDLVFGGRVYRTIQARELWRQISAANYAYAEPGVIFIDRINALNNLNYCEEIRATNPCGEQPLPPYGACLLGSINLARLIDKPFQADASLNLARLEHGVRVGVRLLDSMLDVSPTPLPAQAREAQAKRRIGLGLTGLGDALIMAGVRYGSVAAQRLAGDWMRAIQRSAYLASSELAAEKGSFPLFDAAQVLARPNIKALDASTRAAIARHGLRNGCLTSIAPTGTISLLAGNVSSGIEPVFDFRFNRRLRGPAGDPRVSTVEDYAYALYRRTQAHDLAPGETPAGEAWVQAGDLTPREHMAMQAALQPHVDSAISKTINCPADISLDAFETLYLDAYDLGLKGCTTFRPNQVTGSVLEPVEPPPSSQVVQHSTAPDTVTAPNLKICPRCKMSYDQLDGTCRICPICGHSGCE